ncbi:sugar transferase [Ectobacillus antri]|jgi:lipopolysaccharide/colanic/teichoic acid biosynthesis glycosyltransferase|uniref:Sugar transferase n=1 Tax=Ectobacillus antri TaxID=2486280 RepID=A0ABT6H3P1_9BACI|nr:sugar transferase [Ectobacillus antri]MDG4656605.1 sugar transferase [Ectobacillus antri]MDG5753655.1 sugar transferase [Ectobacillus antri]
MQQFVRLEKQRKEVQKPSLEYLVVKRLVDIVISLVGIIIAVPLILVFSILIICESSGAPIFLQERLGLHGKKFTIIKLRSMKKDAESNGAQWAVKHDARITRVGTFIRRTRIDELPQLFNVLKGDMSIVGPRPERSYFYEEFDGKVIGFRQRLIVKPGITGWAQINGGYDINPHEKLELDLFYIEYIGFKMDILIILKTFIIILTGRGAR